MTYFRPTPRKKRIVGTGAVCAVSPPFPPAIPQTPTDQCAVRVYQRIDMLIVYIHV